jgi:hypothetical protein
MPFHGPRAEEQLRADLGIGAPIACQRGDLSWGVKSALPGPDRRRTFSPVP